MSATTRRNRAAARSMAARIVDLERPKIEAAARAAERKASQQRAARLDAIDREERDAFEILLGRYVALHGPLRVALETVLREQRQGAIVRTRAQFEPRRAVYETVGGGPNGAQAARLGILVMLAVRHVTETETDMNADALLEALASPAISAADPVRLGTAATELAAHVEFRIPAGPVGAIGRMGRSADRTAVLVRCCCLMLPYLEERERADVCRRLRIVPGGSGT